MEGLEPDETMSLVSKHEEEIDRVWDRARRNLCLSRVEYEKNIRRSADITALRFEFAVGERGCSGLRAAPRRLTFSSGYSFCQRLSWGYNIAWPSSLESDGDRSESGTDIYNDIPQTTRKTRRNC